jgi:hypothetical protein
MSMKHLQLNDLLQVLLLTKYNTKFITVTDKQDLSKTFMHIDGGICRYVGVGRYSRMRDVHVPEDKVDTGGDLNPCSQDPADPADPAAQRTRTTNRAVYTRGN